VENKTCQSRFGDPPETKVKCPATKKCIPACKLKLYKNAGNKGLLGTSPQVCKTKEQGGYFWKIQGAGTGNMGDDVNSFYFSKGCDYVRAYDDPDEEEEELVQLRSAGSGSGSGSKSLPKLPTEKIGDIVDGKIIGETIDDVDFHHSSNLPFDLNRDVRGFRIYAKPGTEGC
jgi:hypothetical protein